MNTILTITAAVDWTDDLKHVLIWLLPSVLGVATKLAHDSKSKRLTRSRIVSALIMACFVGYITDKICTYINWISVKPIIIPICALASEPIIQWLLKNTGNGLTAIVLRIFNVDITKSRNQQNELDIPLDGEEEEEDDEN